MHNPNARPGYKWTKLGWVPVEWEVVKLSKLFEIKHGFAFKSEYFSSEGSFVVTTPGHFYAVGGFRRRSNYEKRYSGEFPKEYILKKGDLIVAMTEQGPGLLGSTAKIPYDNLYLHNQRLGLIENIAEMLLDKDYLYYALNSRAIRENVAKESSGTKVKHTSPKGILKLQILLPPLPEQQKIAQILSTWDRAIALTRQLIAAKEEQKKGLMQRLLTGKVRVRGFLGEWEWKKLFEVCQISKGEQLNRAELEKDASYPAYSGGVQPSGYTSKWNTHENTIAISEGGNSCGFVNFIRTKFWRGGHCYALLNIHETLNASFLFYFLKSKERRIMSLRVGSGLPNIQKKDLSNFKLLFPEYPEQIAIANILTKSDEEIDLLKAELEALQKQKQGLMQQLLTGKKRVRV